MKKLILGLFATAALLSSCADNGREVEASEAKEVVKDVVVNAIDYKTVDASSHVEWRATHLGGLQPRFGKISISKANASSKDGVIQSANFVIDMKSMTVENFEAGDEQIGKLYGHLQSEDFFDTANHPTSKFELTSSKKATGGFNTEITGNLTIMGITKSISFNANTTVTDNSIKVVSEDFAVNREDWGIDFNKEGSEGVPAQYIISEDIGFKIDVTLNK